MRARIRRLVSLGFVVDRPGGLGDAVGAEGRQDADGEVAKARHGAGCGPGVDGGGVLDEGDVSDGVRGVLQSPVPAERGSQVGWSALVGVEAGDGVDILPGLALAGLLAAAVDTDGPPDASPARSRPAPSRANSAGSPFPTPAPAGPFVPGRHHRSPRPVRRLEAVRHNGRCASRSRSGRCVRCRRVLRSRGRRCPWRCRGPRCRTGRSVRVVRVVARRSV